MPAWARTLFKRSMRLIVGVADGPSTKADWHLLMSGVEFVALLAPPPARRRAVEHPWAYLDRLPGRYDQKIGAAHVSKRLTRFEQLGGPLTNVRGSEAPYGHTALT